MATKRAFFAAALGATAAAVSRRGGSAQSADGQAPGRDTQEDTLVVPPGMPTGRVGAATRGADGELALDLVAPLRGAGLASADQPALFYLFSGRPARPMRLAISTPGQARPLADVELPRGQSPGLGVVRLRDHGVRLPPGLLCAWSVVVSLDPKAPSRDLVASALIRHRPADRAFEAAAREQPVERRVAALAGAGYWYDAVALAEQNQNRDQGAALAWLLDQQGLRTAAASRAGAATAVR